MYIFVFNHTNIDSKGKIVYAVYHFGFPFDFITVPCIDLVKNFCFSPIRFVL